MRGRHRKKTNFLCLYLFPENTQVTMHKEPHNSRIRTAALLLPAVFILLCFSAQGKDYRMSALDMELRLNEDGSMQVREDREFTFDGDFSFVYRFFPLDGKASFSNLRVFEGDQEYTESDSEAPGTMKITENGTKKELRLFFEASDTTRTFTFRFTADGATEKYRDNALFYYQLISDEWDQSIHHIRARIYPPEPLPEGEPAHWVHGSLDAVSQILEDGIIQVTLDRLPANSYLELRALYPAGVFPGLPVIEKEIREEVMEEAAALTEEANRLRREAMEKKAREEARHQRGKQLVLPVSLLYILIWVTLLRKYSKKPSLSEKPGAFTRLPAKDKPAIVNYLMNRTEVNGNAMVSTLFHLAYRGFVRLESTEETKKGFFGTRKLTKTSFILNRTYWETHKENLLPFENELLHFLFNELAENKDQLSLQRMKKKSTRMQKFFTKWKKKVTQEAKKKSWFDQQSKKGQQIGLVISIIAMLGFIGMAIFYGPWMLFPAGLSFISLIVAFLMLQRTAEGEKTYRQWKSLRQYLKRSHFQSEMDNLDEETVNEYLVYGLALGLGTKYFRNLTEGLESSGNTGYIAWIVLHNARLQSVGDTINTVITTTSTTMSSASGAGGGGTAGGGAGASSGGGGAG